MPNAPALVIWDERGKRTFLELTTERVVIGTAPECTYQVKGHDLPARAFEIYPAASGWALRPLEPCEALSLNWLAVEEETLLSDGDTLRLGGYTFQLWLAPAEPPETQKAQTKLSSRLFLLPWWQVVLMAAALVGLYFLTHALLVRHYAAISPEPLPVTLEKTLITLTSEDMLEALQVESKRPHLVPVELLDAELSASSDTICFEAKRLGADKVELDYFVPATGARVNYKLKQQDGAWKILERKVSKPKKEAGD